jgi:thioredoxin
LAIDDWKLFALALNLSFLVGFLIEWKDYVFCLLVVKKLYLGVSTLFSPLFSCYFFTELEPIMAIKIVTDATLEADVLKATRPFILAVGATWCADCRRAAPFFQKFAGEFADRADFGAADSEKNPAIVEKYRVVNIPTMVVVKNGEEVDRVVEVRTPSELKAFIEKNL